MEVGSVLVRRRKKRGENEKAEKEEEKEDQETAAKGKSVPITRGRKGGKREH